MRINMLAPPDLSGLDDPMERLAVYLAYEHTDPADRRTWAWDGCESHYKASFRVKAARYLNAAGVNWDVRERTPQGTITDREVDE